MPDLRCPTPASHWRDGSSAIIGIFFKEDAPLKIFFAVDLTAA